MKILFYEWALHDIGGGQKFNCKIIEHLSKNHVIDVLTLFPVSKKRLESYYSVDLSKTRIINLYDSSKIHQTLLKLLVSKKVSKMSSKYDLFYNAETQESIKPQAKHNIMYCHFFEPKWYRPAKGFFDFFKLTGIYLLKTLQKNYAKKYKIYCNSLYTQKCLKKLWKVDAEVLYPPVDIPKQRLFKKQNLIVSVGRLTPDKSYDFIIKLFKQMLKNSVIKNYKLLICGKIYNSDYLKKLKQLSKDNFIEFKTDLTNKQLKSIYKKSKIFIQAKGLNINEKKYPGFLEHFGMTTIEAMSYGCVPVVLNKGGYKETVENNRSGFLFDSEDEAIEKLKLLVKNEKLRKDMSKQAVKRAKKFSLQRMQREIDKMMNSL